jgi:hypothetical protein
MHSIKIRSSAKGMRTLDPCSSIRRALFQSFEVSNGAPKKRGASRQ